MKPEIRNFLEFNGKAIFFLHKDGQYWVAIRPICEALNIDHTWQFKTIKKHQILGRVWYAHTMHDASGRLQKMLALPEKYVYGWLFQIKSNNPDLLKYQYECYEILYDHFHGTITRRKEILKTKASIQQEMKVLETRLAASDDYQQLVNLRAAEMRTGKALKEMDDTLLKEQLSLFKQ